MATSKRIGWVDAAKGFAILSIITGHLCAFFMNDLEFAEAVFLVTGTFHVPLFFLLSGYTMKPKWLGMSGIAKLAKRCFLPYVFAGVVSVLICLAFVDGHTLYDFVFGFFYGAGAYRDHILFGDTSQVNAIGLIWFLPALFVGKILASALARLPMLIRFGISSAMFLAAAYSAPVLFLPFDIQQGMCACWFITFGMFLREENMFSAVADIRTRLLGYTMAAVGCMYICSALAGRSSIPMYCNSTYHEPVMDMLFCVGCCVAAIYAVKFTIEHFYIIERALTWCGINSIALFAFHAITLSPGDSVKWWIRDLVTAGADPVVAFTVSLAINLAIVLSATIISHHIKPLMRILYGAAPPHMPETSCLGRSHSHQPLVLHHNRAAS